MSRDVLVTSVQPFALGSPGGGPKILRSVLAGLEAPFAAVCTLPGTPTIPLLRNEVHIPNRRSFGRIEATRFGFVADVGEFSERRRFRMRLATACQASDTTVIHGLAHSMDFWPAFQTARLMGVGYCLSIHDDLAYHARVRPFIRAALPRLRQVWKEAGARTVITEALGEEYCRRYGPAPYTVVTDGVDTYAEAPTKNVGWRLYFMGLPHISYTPNFSAIVRALETISRKFDDSATLICRCGGLPAIPDPIGLLRVLPFGTDADLAEDFLSADMLYLPMPFDPRYDLFTRFSFSTKAVSYLATGIPIIYHGPRDSATGRLLAKHDAAVFLDNLNPEQLASELEHLSDSRRKEIASNALELARTNFRLRDQQRNFRDAILSCT